MMMMTTAPLTIAVAVPRLGPGAETPKSWLAASNLAVLLIHCCQLILRNISKSDATRCQILRLKCTKFDFRWGSAPDPRELTALPRPPCCI